MLLAQLAVLCTSVAGRAFASRGLLAGTALAVSYSALAARAVNPSEKRAASLRTQLQEIEEKLRAKGVASEELKRLRSEVASGMKNIGEKRHSVSEEMRRVVEEMEREAKRLEEKGKEIQNNFAIKLRETNEKIQGADVSVLGGELIRAEGRSSGDDRGYRQSPF